MVHGLSLSHERRPGVTQPAPPRTTVSTPRARLTSATCIPTTMSSSPPQLRLSLPPTTTSFKRSFSQFGFDLESPGGPGPEAGSSSSSGMSSRDGTGNSGGATGRSDRNKRARSASYETQARARAGPSSSLSSGFNSRSGASNSGSGSESDLSSITSPSSSGSIDLSLQLSLTDMDVSLRRTSHPPRLPRFEVEMEDSLMAMTDRDEGPSPSPPEEEEEPPRLPPIGIFPPTPSSSSRHQRLGDRSYRLSLDRQSSFDRHISSLREPPVSSFSESPVRMTPPPTLPPIPLTSSVEDLQDLENASESTIGIGGSQYHHEDRDRPPFHIVLDSALEVLRSPSPLLPLPIPGVELEEGSAAPEEEHQPSAASDDHRHQATTTIPGNGLGPVPPPMARSSARLRDRELSASLRMEQSRRLRRARIEEMEERVTELRGRPELSLDIRPLSPLWPPDYVPGDIQSHAEPSRLRRSRPASALAHDVEADYSRSGAADYGASFMESSRNSGSPSSSHNRIRSNPHVSESEGPAGSGIPASALLAHRSRHSRSEVDSWTSDIPAFFTSHDRSATSYLDAPPAPLALDQFLETSSLGNPRPSATSPSSSRPPAVPSGGTSANADSRSGSLFGSRRFSHNEYDFALADDLLPLGTEARRAAERTRRGAWSRRTIRDPRLMHPEGPFASSTSSSEHSMFSAPDVTTAFHPSNSPFGLAPIDHHPEYPMRIFAPAVAMDSGMMPNPSTSSSRTARSGTRTSQSRHEEYLPSPDLGTSFPTSTEYYTPGAPPPPPDLALNTRAHPDDPNPMQHAGFTPRPRTGPGSAAGLSNLHPRRLEAYLSIPGFLESELDSGLASGASSLPQGSTVTTAGPGWFERDAYQSYLDRDLERVQGARRSSSGFRSVTDPSQGSSTSVGPSRQDGLRRVAHPPSLPPLPFVGDSAAQWRDRLDLDSPSEIRPDLGAGSSQPRVDVDSTDPGVLFRRGARTHGRSNLDSSPPTPPSFYRTSAHPGLYGESQITREHPTYPATAEAEARLREIANARRDREREQNRDVHDLINHRNHVLAARASLDRSLTEASRRSGMASASGSGVSLFEGRPDAEARRRIAEDLERRQRRVFAQSATAASADSGISSQSQAYHPPLRLGRYQTLLGLRGSAERERTRLGHVDPSGLGAGASEAGGSGATDSGPSPSASRAQGEFGAMRDTSQPPRLSLRAMQRQQAMRRNRTMGDYMRDEDFDDSYESLLTLAARLGDVRPRGTPSSVIEGMPSGTYEEWASEDGDKRCPICLDDYAPEDPVMKLPDCSHWLHKECLQQWLQSAHTCPICRKEVKISGGRRNPQLCPRHSGVANLFSSSSSDVRDPMTSPSTWRILPSDHLPTHPPPSGGDTPTRSFRARFRRVGMAGAAGRDEGVQAGPSRQHEAGPSGSSSSSATAGSSTSASASVSRPSRHTELEADLALYYANRAPNSPPSMHASTNADASNSSESWEAIQERAETALAQARRSSERAQSAIDSANLLSMSINDTLRDIDYHLASPTLASVQGASPSTINTSTNAASSANSARSPHHRPSRSLSSLSSFRPAGMPLPNPSAFDREFQAWFDPESNNFDSRSTGATIATSSAGSRNSVSSLSSMDDREPSTTEMNFGAPSSLLHRPSTLRSSRDELLSRYFRGDGLTGGPAVGSGSGSGLGTRSRTTPRQDVNGMSDEAVREDARRHILRSELFVGASDDMGGDVDMVALRDAGFGQAGGSAGSGTATSSDGDAMSDIEDARTSSMASRTQHRRTSGPSIMPDGFRYSIWGDVGSGGM